MNLSVVLILYNAVHLLQENFGNIVTHIKNEVPEAEFIFVDNNSTDGSLDYLAHHFPEGKILQQGQNLFFAPSANRGIHAAQHELILLLNLDIQIYRLNFQEIHTLFAQDQTIFSVSPKVIDPRNQKQEHLFNIRIRKGLIDLVEPNDFDPERQREITYATGGAVFLRRNYFIAMRGFREIYAPFYWDDPDLGIRAISNGWKNIYFPDSIIYHYHSSQISSYFKQNAIKRIYERNRLVFFFLHTRKLTWRLRFFFWLPLKLLFSLATDTYFFYGWLEFLKLRPRLKSIPSQSDEIIFTRFS